MIFSSSEIEKLLENTVNNAPYDVKHDVIDMEKEPSDIVLLPRRKGNKKQDVEALRMGLYKLFVSIHYLHSLYLLLKLHLD